jgi:hypothetical protein
MVILMPKSQTVAAGFEAQTGKPSITLVLRLNQEIVASKPSTTDFEAKPEKPLPSVLRPNRRNRCHWF